LDIVPVYIHGNSEVLPKGDFIIYDGAITVKIGERIKNEDESFGKNYSERTKKINAYFRKEFAALRNELENENYFKKKLFLSFLYKDNEVVSAVKKDFENNKSVYFELGKHIPKNANILHLADDFGQKDILVTLQQAGRKIFSYIQDVEKRQIAEQNYLIKRRKISYIKNFDEVTKSIDVLLISDENFNIGSLEMLPETIIFCNVKNNILDNADYALKFSYGSLKIFTSQ
jgi:hypothetical protein